MAKAFDTVWIDGLLYKLTPVNFPTYSPYNLILPPGSDVRNVLPRHLVEACELEWLRED
jgi:hypothetical protein